MGKGKRAYLTGQRFGRLLVIESAGKHQNGNYQWKCICDCGQEKTVFTSNLTGGLTVSCGCIQAENRIKHGHAVNGICSPEYRSWVKMRIRCTDNRGPQWSDYGGRCITFCERWDDFSLFLADMGPMPGNSYTIERINNDGNYEPNNCKWATRKEQARNRRDNRLITFDGQTLTMIEWAEKTGLRFNLIWDRINRGWDIGLALTLPPNRGRKV